MSFVSQSLLYWLITSFSIVTQMHESVPPPILHGLSPHPVETSMSRSSTRGDVFPIFFRRESSESFSDEDDWKEGECTDQGNHGHSNEAILQAHSTDPGVNSITDRESQSVSNYDY